MATYNEKLEDSFITKLKIFLFTKAFDGHVMPLIEDPKMEEEFNNFVLDIEKANIFSSQFYQFEKEANIEYGGKIKKSIELVNNLLGKSNYIIATRNLKSYLGESYDKLFQAYKENPPITEQEYKDLISAEQCSYCGIRKDDIWDLLGSNGLLHNKRSETRGYSLEVDRKYPNLEYTKTNCCMSCYWCNNAKTDEYTAQEFKPIARGINQAWNDRLKKAGINETICFPENSKVWE